jgi:glucoamylase
VEEFKSEYAYLYNPILPANSTIKADLEYKSNHWTELSYDPWEESYAYGHFFNKIAFREALSVGAKLARKLGDNGAAEWYELQLIEVKEFLDDFWDSTDGYIKSSIGHQHGVKWKKKNLDTSALIAVLFANSSAENDPYSLSMFSINHAKHSIQQSHVDPHGIKYLIRTNILH